MTNYINTPGNEVPDNTILVVPHSIDHPSHYEEIIESLAGKTKRNWFTDHFYFCTPLVIGNQYGFIIKSTRNFTVNWSGGEEEAIITYNDELENKQIFSNHFKNGVLTVQNRFALKTAPNINLMTIQPPNHYIPGLIAMTGVVETDNIRRDFTFNLRVTIPNFEIKVKAGDALGAFIPIPRGTIEKYKVKLITDIFSKEQHILEIEESNKLASERANEDKSRPHASGRRYFKGVHTTGELYKNHQKGAFR